MSAFIFLGGFKINAMKDTSSVNIGKQNLIGLDSASTTKTGGSPTFGDFDAICAPTVLPVNNDIENSSRLLSPDFIEEL